MKISVLITHRNKGLIPRLKDFFDRRFVLSSFYLIDSAWSLDGESRLVEVLKSSYDFLIVCDREDLSSQWIPYITGFSQDKDNRIIRRINTLFLLSGNRDVLPRWLKNFSVNRNLSDLSKYFETIRINWHRMDDVVAANHFLEIIGYDKLATPTMVGDPEKDIMLLELYLERGGDPNYVSDKGVPLICEIIRKNEAALVKHLMNRGCSVNVVSGDRGTTPLMEASSLGRTELVKLLIEMGADLNHASKEGQTALILAIGNRYEETARILLEEGADPKHKDQLGMDARKYAQLYGFSEIAELLEENMDD
jgi:uncharacterized protein